MSICLAGNHDLVVLGKISLATFGGEAGAAAAWTREVLDLPHVSFWRHSLQRRHDRRGALPRQPTRPGLGLRDQREAAHGGASRKHRAARARRTQSRGLALPRRRAPGSSAARRPRAPALDLAPRGGFSIPVRSASPATAIRAPPGSRLISRLGGQPSAVPTIRSSGRRPRCVTWISPRSWQRASSTASSSTPRKWGYMAELTNLETKLGEVIGLAMAAQAATERVEKLTDDRQLASALKKMRKEAAQARRTAPQSLLRSTARRARSSPRPGR